MPTINAGQKQFAKCIDLRGMPRMKARVEIAKDVLAALDNHVIEPGSVYFSTRHHVVPGKANLRDFIGERVAESKAIEEDCAPIRACAIGAVFTATVARVNKFKGDPEDDEMREFLKPWFTERELLLMEAAFENMDLDYVDRAFGPSYGEYVRRYRKRIEAVSDSFYLPEYKLRTLMNAIIESGGREVLPKAKNPGNR